MSRWKCYQLFCVQERWKLTGNDNWAVRLGYISLREKILTYLSFNPLPEKWCRTHQHLHHCRCRLSMDGNPSSLCTKKSLSLFTMGLWNLIIERSNPGSRGQRFGRELHFLANWHGTSIVLLNSHTKRQFKSSRNGSGDGGTIATVGGRRQKCPSLGGWALCNCVAFG